MANDYRNRPNPRFSEWDDDRNRRDKRRDVRGEHISGDNNYGIDNDRDYRFREQQWRMDAHPQYPVEQRPVNAAFGTRMGNFGQIVYDPSYGIDSFGYHNESDAGHRGKGPKNYLRSDERISEDINDRLHDDPYVDASNIEVRIDKCEVVLSGTVDSLHAKRRAADIAEDVRGVRHVENHIRVRDESQQQYKYPTATTTGGATNTNSEAERNSRSRR